MYSDGTVVIDNTETYKNYLKKYNCKNLDELDNLLWFNYGVSLELSQKMKNRIKLMEEYADVQELSKNEVCPETDEICVQSKSDETTCKCDKDEFIEATLQINEKVKKAERELRSKLAQSYMKVREDNIQFT
jgi:hypothetical protein